VHLFDLPCKAPGFVTRLSLCTHGLFQAAIATFDFYGVYLGDRLGLYHALGKRGPSTAGELAEAAGIDRRYAREWLEQQAASGILAVKNTEDAPNDRRFVLPATTRTAPPGERGSRRRARFRRTDTT
jgi:hypothetical protein